jgi:hypothetical protein
VPEMLYGPPPEVLPRLRAALVRQFARQCGAARAPFRPAGPCGRPSSGGSARPVCAGCRPLAGADPQTNTP